LGAFPFPAGSGEWSGDYHQSRQRFLIGLYITNTQCKSVILCDGKPIILEEAIEKAKISDGI